ncbi:unnamed protein product [Protopolystoma xenopodis]|uniref:Uncharacterized protein n=1 Tax=Protopolystoma xenopodis TaxID=117903 RepID=A0A3S5AIS7_9PLAT|nr:unnamed protein product [Protopolystoma xenopodis]
MSSSDVSSKTKPNSNLFTYDFSKCGFPSIAASGNDTCPNSPGSNSSNLFARGRGRFQAALSKMKKAAVSSVSITPSSSLLASSSRAESGGLLGASRLAAEHRIPSEMSGSWLTKPHFNIFFTMHCVYLIPNSLCSLR